MTSILRRAPRLIAFLLLPSLVAGQAPTPPAPPRPAPGEFRVYLISDMEGMASVVFNREIISGYEGERYRNASSQDYWTYYRELFTREVNAAIAGARRGGARSFVVNEGHGGNLFGNLLPQLLDSAAILIRGWPKPMVMSTGLDSTSGAVFLVGGHAGPRSGGVIAHNYAFDRFSVDGKSLNETGINALVAGEYGVPLVLVSGDHIMVGQAKEQLGPSVVGVITKWALGSNAAITLSPAVVRQMLADSAAVAVRRALRGEIRPFTLPKPYQIDFTLRRSYPDSLVAPLDTLSTFRLTKTGDRTYRFVTDDAREMARLLDAIEVMVLR